VLAWRINAKIRPKMRRVYYIVWWLEQAYSGEFSWGIPQVSTSLWCVTSSGIPGGNPNDVIIYNMSQPYHIQEIKKILFKNKILKICACTIPPSMLAEMVAMFAKWNVVLWLVAICLHCLKLSPVLPRNVGPQPVTGIWKSIEIFSLHIFENYNQNTDERNSSFCRTTQHKCFIPLAWDPFVHSCFYPSQSFSEELAIGRYCAAGRSKQHLLSHSGSKSGHLVQKIVYMQTHKVISYKVTHKVIK